MAAGEEQVHIVCVPAKKVLAVCRDAPRHTWRRPSEPPLRCKAVQHGSAKWPKQQEVETNKIDKKMKKLVRKSMFVLSFMGLFTFGAPKQAKAESNPCAKTIITCNGESHEVVLCEGDDILPVLEKYCGVTVIVIGGNDK
jgi:hypothetical protein